MPADEGSAGRGRKWIGRDPVAVDVSIEGDLPFGGDAGGVVMSANGRVVAFHSPARDVTTQYGGGRYHVYVRDLREPRAVMASTSSDSLAAAAGDSLWPVLGSIGRYLAFVGDADDLVPGDGNGRADVFVRDRRRGVTALVSVSIDGAGSGNGRSSAGRGEYAPPSLSRRLPEPPRSALPHATRSPQHDSRSRRARSEGPGAR